MTDITLIPLSKLSAWDGNVRKTAGADTALAELAASITAHGLINNLVVNPEKKGTHAVVTGGRRLAALQMLVKQKKLPEHHPVPCQILTAEANAQEISLAENVVREQMHPADEFEAFKKLADSGTPAADIGARFGVTEKVVLQRLKLARVSPVIIKAFRDGKTSLECVMAFAVTDDHKRQERYWKSAPGWQKERPSNIREALTEGEIPASAPRVRFVTLKAYEAAGGTVRRDLFTDGDEGVFIANIDVLNKAVADKVDAAKQKLLKDGWKWAEFLPEDGWETRNKHRRLDVMDTDKFPAKKKAVSGVFIELADNGRLEIRGGYLKADDVKAAKAAEPKAKKSATDKPAQKAGLSQSLTEDLIGERTAAVAALLSGNPDLALRTVVHGIALEAIYPHAFVDTPIGLSIDGTSYPVGFEERCKSKAIIDHENRRKAWEKKLPGKAKLWQWCLDADQKELLSLLAFCAACSINDDEMLTSHLGLDMTKWFTPNVGNYFGRVGKPELIAAMKEAGKAASPTVANMKKGALAIHAEQAVKGTTWLPKLLRTANAKPDKKPLKKAA